jgi:hypothetical protein
MPSWRLNDVPIAMYFATHFYFSSYHVFANLALRKLRTRYAAGAARDPNPKPDPNRKPEPNPKPDPKPDPDPNPNPDPNPDPDPDPDPGPGPGPNQAPPATSSSSA